MPVLVEDRGQGIRMHVSPDVYGIHIGIQHNVYIKLVVGRSVGRSRFLRSVGRSPVWTAMSWGGLPWSHRGVGFLDVFAGVLDFSSLETDELRTGLMV